MGISGHAVGGARPKDLAVHPGKIGKTIRKRAFSASPAFSPIMPLLPPFHSRELSNKAGNGGSVPGLFPDKGLYPAASSSFWLMRSMTWE